MTVGSPSTTLRMTDKRDCFAPLAMTVGSSSTRLAPLAQGIFLFFISLFSTLCTLSPLLGVSQQLRIGGEALDNETNLCGWSRMSEVA